MRHRGYTEFLRNNYISFQIYHRQIFKVLLSNKVLEDPRQRRLFKTSDLVELFNFNESIGGHSSESDQLFRESKLTPATAKFSSSKIEKMRKLAIALSKNISRNASNSVSAPQNTAVPENSCASSYNNGNSQESLRNNKIFKDSLIEQKTEIKGSLCDKDEGALTSEKQHTNEANREENEKAENTECVTQNNPPSIIKDITENKEKSSKNIEIKTSESLVDSKEVKVSKDLGKLNETSSSNKTENTVSKSSKTHRKHKRKKECSESEDAPSAIFEGEHVSYLLGRRLRRSEPEQPTSTEDDQYVLGKLFAKASNYLSGYIIRTAVLKFLPDSKILFFPSCDFRFPT